MSRERDEDFESDRTAYIAFHSSAIAGFKPQKARYRSEDEYAMEVNDFADAVAMEAFSRYKAAEAEGFPFEELVLDEDDEEEDERPRARRRA
jgi:hypothetical protein